MRVLHVITALSFGGAETMLAKLLESSPGDLEQTAVLSLLPPGSAEARFRQLGVQIFSPMMQRGFWSPLAPVRLARIVNSYAPDILHGWMYHGNLAATWGSWMMTKPVSVVWNVRHSLADPQRESRRNRALIKLSAAVSRNPKAIIYNSFASSRQHHDYGYAPEQNVIIPNGFNCTTYRPDLNAKFRLCNLFGIDPATLIVGLIARMHPMKDHRMLIEAVSRARSQGLDIHLLMVGHGLEQLPDDFDEFVRRHIPSNRVTITGDRKDVAAWLPGLDILAMSSAWGEGFPNVIGEGLACGVPVVATEVGDSAMVVGDSGAIVPPSDPQAFAAALVKMGTLSHEARHSLGMAGRERIVEQFSIDKITKRYGELHRRLFDDARSSKSPEPKRTGIVGGTTS